MSRLSTRRLNLMRLGYAFVGVGLALTRWPSLVLDARSLPVMEGVVLSMLTAMSLLMLLGLRQPVRLLPVLLFEVAWKVLWIAAVALPRMASGDLGGRAGELLVNCSLVVVVIAVIPWRYVWEHYALAPGDPWRAPVVEDVGRNRSAVVEEVGHDRLETTAHGTVVSRQAPRGPSSTTGGQPRGAFRNHR